MILNAVLAVLGLLLLGAGMFLIYPPLAVLLAGAVLVAAGFLREVPDGEAD